MAVSLKHKFTSAKSDVGDTSLVRPSNWNDEHDLTLATDKLLGRATAGTGAVEEITCTAAGRDLLDDANAAAQRTTLGAAASGANTDITSVYLNNTGLKIKDTNASHGLIIAPGSNITADRTLTVTTGDANRTLALSGNLTVNGATTISTAGANLIDDADAAAQRTTLGVAYASTTEVLTGTEAAKVATPDSIAALWEQGSDVASAATVSLGEGGYFNITGTTTITDIDFATDKAGRRAWVKFAGALTLTHNATSLILPGGANITTAAGDTALFISEGGDNVRCLSYNKASGLPAVASGVTSLGTLNPSSGSESGLTGLDLSTYKFLYIVLEGPNSTSGSATVRMSQASGSGQVSFTSETATNGPRGFALIDLTNGSFFAVTASVGGTASGTAVAIAGDANITTASTAVYMSMSAGTFTGGAMRFYGVK